MHELGHWLSHWPMHQSENWAKGYSAKHKKTHESYAQLIAYWAVEDDFNLKNLLEIHLTPSKVDDPYALYKNLTEIDETIILKRLVEIRKHAFLTDELMYAFLKGNYKSIDQIFTNENEKNISSLKIIDHKDYKKVLYDLSKAILKELPPESEHRDFLKELKYKTGGINMKNRFGQ